MLPITLGPPPFEFPEEERTLTPTPSQPRRILVAEDDPDNGQRVNHREVATATQQ